MELHTRACPLSNRPAQLGAWGTIAVGVLTSAMLGALLLITTGKPPPHPGPGRRRTAELQAASALHENQTALVDAQRIARLGSWDDHWTRGGLNASVELPCCSPAKPMAPGFPWTTSSTRSPQPAAGALDSMRSGARGHGSGRIMLDCNTGQLPMRTAVAVPRGRAWAGRLQRIAAPPGRHRLREARHASATSLALTRSPGCSAAAPGGTTPRDVLRHAVRHGIGAPCRSSTSTTSEGHDSLGPPPASPAAQVACRSRRLRTRGRPRRPHRRRRVRDPVAAPRARRACSLPSVLDASPAPADDGQPLRVGGASASPFIPPTVAGSTRCSNARRHRDVRGQRGPAANAYRFFLPEMTQRVTRRLQTEAELHRVEEAAICACYQPQIDAASGRYAAARPGGWQHPRAGPDLAGPLRPFAEQSGLIVPLGNGCCAKPACSRCCWRDADLPPPRRRVNISGAAVPPARFRRHGGARAGRDGADPAGSNWRSPRAR